MTTTEIKCIFIANKWNASSDIDYAAIADYWKVVRSHLTKRKQLSTRHCVRRSSPLENAIGAHVYYGLITCLCFCDNKTTTYLSPLCEGPHTMSIGRSDRDRANVTKGHKLLIFSYGTAQGRAFCFPQVGCDTSKPSSVRKLRYLSKCKLPKHIRFFLVGVQIITRSQSDSGTRSQNQLVLEILSRCRYDNGFSDSISRNIICMTSRLSMR